MSSQDTKITGASYLYTFYEHVGQLTNEYSNYINAVLYLENKYGNINDEGFEEIDKNTFTQQLQVLRYWINKTHIIYKALIPYTKSENKVTIHYDKIKNAFVINREYVYKFVQECNNFLASEVISALLTDNQELINDIFRE